MVIQIRLGIQKDEQNISQEKVLKPTIISQNQSSKWKWSNVVPENFRSFEGVLKDMAVGAGGDERSLEKTPTWAVVVVC
jgi:hypothetical protein